MASCRNGHVKCVDILLAYARAGYRLRVGAVDSRGWNAVMYAVGEPDILRRLFEVEVVRHGLVGDSTIEDGAGDREACGGQRGKSGDGDVLLWDLGGEFEAEERMTPLMVASRMGILRSVKILLAVYTSLLHRNSSKSKSDTATTSITTCTTQSPSHPASIPPRPKTVPNLTTVLSNINTSSPDIRVLEYVNRRDKKGRTAFWWACHMGKVDVAVCLAEYGCDVETRDEEGFNGADVVRMGLLVAEGVGRGVGEDSRNGGVAGNVPREDDLGEEDTEEGGLHEDTTTADVDADDANERNEDDARASESGEEEKQVGTNSQVGKKKKKPKPTPPELIRKVID
ncbi:hypothetical protein HK102_011996, partial [Quaeritorhiza haematococci]